MPMPNIAWGITGATDKLEATFEQMEKVAAMKDVRITTFISQAGIEIILHCGLKKRLEAISDGGPYREICAPKTHGASMYLTGRFFAKEYEACMVAPCSSNSLCKLRYGLADTPVTSAVCWALKGGCPVFVLQTHLTIAHHDSPLWVRLDETVCRRCDDCPPERACKPRAITRRNKFPSINLLKCRRCMDCVRACPYNAIVGKERFRLNKRMVDQEAAEELSKVRGLAVLKEPREIGQTLERYCVELPSIRLD